MQMRKEETSDPRIQLAFVLAVGGMAGFALGWHPEWLGLATTPEVGFLQIMFMVVGMGVYAGSSIWGMRLLWGRPWSLLARVGARVMATGYVAFAAAVMADVLGLGSQTWPNSAHFGPIQWWGMLAGEALMVAGLLMMYPYRFLLTKEEASHGETS